MATADLSRQIDPCCDPVLCRCLRVRESVVLEALEDESIRTLRDLRRETGAGSGCNSCHCTLKQYLQQQRRLSELVAEGRAMVSDLPGPRPFETAGNSASRLAG